MSLRLPCSACGTELTESQMFAFYGTVGCERCVTNYEKTKLCAVPELGRKYAAASLKLEVETRRRNAIAWLKRNRRYLEKQMPKRAAQR